MSAAVRSVLYCAAGAGAVAEPAGSGDEAFEVVVAFGAAVFNAVVFVATRLGVAALGAAAFVVIGLGVVDFAAAVFDGETDGASDGDADRATDRDVDEDAVAAAADDSGAASMILTRSAMRCPFSS